MSTLFKDIDQPYLTSSIVKRFHNKLSSDPRIQFLMNDNKSKKFSAQQKPVLVPVVQDSKLAVHTIAHQYLNIIAEHLVETCREYGLSEKTISQAGQMLKNMKLQSLIRGVSDGDIDGALVFA